MAGETARKRGREEERAGGKEREREKRMKEKWKSE